MANDTKTHLVHQYKRVVDLIEQHTKKIESLEDKLNDDPLMKNLKHSKKSLKLEQIELKKLSDEIINYTKEKNINKIIGKEFDLILKTEITNTYPYAGHKTRTEFENFLKKNNYWNDVATLNIKMFSNLIKKGKLDPSKFSKYEIEEVTKNIVLEEHIDDIEININPVKKNVSEDLPF